MADWDSGYVSRLADAAFGCIDAGGTKDESGRTVPRSLRHYPHHSADGALDLPHLRNALSRSAQAGAVDVRLYGQYVYCDGCEFEDRGDRLPGGPCTNAQHT